MDNDQCNYEAIEDEVREIGVNIFNYLLNKIHELDAPDCCKTTAMMNVSQAVFIASIIELSFDGKEETVFYSELPHLIENFTRTLGRLKNAKASN